MDKFSGGCACGKVRYTCQGKVLYMGNCHCRDCQRATGSAYFPAVLVKNGDLEINALPVDVQQAVHPHRHY